MNLFYILFLFNFKLFNHYNYFTITLLNSNNIINQNNLTLSFEFSEISFYYSSITLFITFFVNIFLYVYTKTEQNKVVFFILINYFFFFMFLFFNSNNIILSFLFWELIGIVSYFLINFFYFRPITFKSSIKALSFNKFSDFSFIVVIVVFYNITGSFYINSNNISNMLFYNLNIKLFFFKVNSLTLFLFFLSNCCFVKSAQIMYHFWLPDSMEAPLPASALIHSATLVAAGIFLFTKFSILFFYNNNAICYILFYFTITFFVGSLISCYQTDIKKILAYSTISNCGLMFFSIFFSSLKSNLLYFSYHGLYKSLSFIIAGQLVMQFKHNQDIKLFSNYNHTSIIKLSYFFLSLLSLSSSFIIYESYIKHIIFNNNVFNTTLKFLLINSIIFSIIYSYKTCFYFFLKKNIKNSKNHKHSYELLIVLVFLLFIYFFFKYSSFSYTKFYSGLYNKYSVYVTLTTTYFFFKLK